MRQTGNFSCYDPGGNGKEDIVSPNRGWTLMLKPVDEVLIKLLVNKHKIE